MTRRTFHLYQAERTATRRVERAATVLVVLGLMAHRRAILGAGWVADRTPRRRTR